VEPTNDLPDAKCLCRGNFSGEGVLRHGLGKNEECAQVVTQ
jgi:hypothetical protein